MKEQQEGLLAPQIYGYSKLVILAINHSGMKLTPHYYVFYVNTFKKNIHIMLSHMSHRTCIIDERYRKNYRCSWRGQVLYWKATAFL